MRVLFLSHAHPAQQAGGTEIFARDLFRTLRRHHGAQGLFVAGTHAGRRSASPGTAFQAVAGEADELLLWTGGFDHFFQSQIDNYGVGQHLAELLASLSPDLVHVHHLMTLGVEVLGLIRRVVPAARIVMTLHDYYAICANDGQMVTTGGALCSAASLDACARCFPDRDLADVRLRQLHVAAALRLVDRFISPSHFLVDRYVAWGLPPDRITVISNGLPERPPAPLRATSDGRRDRFGFFGHINKFKGAMVALRASERLSRAGVAHRLILHGGTDFQPEPFVTKFGAALAAAPDACHLGPYSRDDLPRLMAPVDWVLVPSVWWENAPLVIQEAFQHRRPVITSAIGGMAEAVRDGVDGLTVPPGDDFSLAQAMRRAIEEDGLHGRLSAAITPPVTIAQAATAHAALYRALLDAPATPRIAA
jgi:glycosyltransferase involved in cell wall biosynthesis